MDLSKIPGEEVEGLNRDEVESDRKKYWEKFYQKVCSRIFYAWIIQICFSWSV